MIDGIIGVRYARNCHPDDLWTKYFTSSVLVLEYRWLYGEPDIIEVRQVFNTGEDARSFEELVIEDLNAVYDSRWLNRAKCWKDVQFYF